MLLNCGVGEDSWEFLSKEIKPVNPKGNQSWIFIGRTDAEAETLILWPPDAKNWLIRKELDAGKYRRQEKKGTTEDEMVGWPHQLNGHEFEQAPGVRDVQGNLVCCSPWGDKELDTTKQLNWTECKRKRLTDTENKLVLPVGASLIAQLVKNPPAMQESPVDPWVRKSAGEGIGYPLQSSGLENSKVTKSQTWLSDSHFTSLHFTSGEKREGPHRGMGVGGTNCWV